MALEVVSIAEFKELLHVHLFFASKYLVGLDKSPLILLLSSDEYDGACYRASWVVDVYAVGTRCRSVGTDDVRTGAVRRRSAGKARVLLASRLHALTAAQLSVVAVSICVTPFRISNVL